MSITSGRSLRRLVGRSGEEASVRVREPAVRNSSARGWVEDIAKSSSMDMSVSEASEESAWPLEELLRRLLRSDEFPFVCLAHSGVGWRRSYCLLRRLIYSLPLMTSSASVLRSFRSRVCEVSETEIRSSSLSTQAGCPWCSWSKSPFLDGGAASRLLG
jgi:hypothetical protein